MDNHTKLNLSHYAAYPATRGVTVFARPLPNEDYVPLAARIAKRISGSVSRVRASRRLGPITRAN